MNFFTHTHSQQSLQRPAAPAGTGLGAKARVAQNLGEICRGECGSWVRNLIQIYHDKKRFAATKSAEDSNEILAQGKPRATPPPRRRPRQASHAAFWAFWRPLVSKMVGSPSGRCHLRLPTGDSGQPNGLPFHLDQSS